MATRQKKKPRGRPTKMAKLIADLQENVVSGEELFAKSYSEACQLVIDIMNDESAPQATRLNAAKTVRESVEKALEFYEDESAEVEEEDDSNPSIRLVI